MLLGPSIVMPLLFTLEKCSFGRGGLRIGDVDVLFDSHSCARKPHNSDDLIDQVRFWVNDLLIMLRSESSCNAYSLVYSGVVTEART